MCSGLCTVFASFCLALWTHICSSFTVWIALFLRNGEPNSPIQWGIVLAAVMCLGIQHKRASHADMDLPLLDRYDTSCMRVFQTAWTLPFPSVQLYNSNQLHMLSRLKSVCVRADVCQISPQVFLFLSGLNRGRYVYAEPIPLPVHTLILLHIKRRRM